jgi:hypothetical protein
MLVDRISVFRTVSVTGMSLYLVGSDTLDAVVVLAVKDRLNLSTSISSRISLEE